MENHLENLQKFIDFFLKNRLSEKDYQNIDINSTDELEDIIEFLRLKKSMHFESLLLDDSGESIDDFHASTAYSIDNLSSFFDLAKSSKLFQETSELKGLSVKVSENRKQILDFISTNLSISRTKLLQEIVSTYLDSAYYSYLLGKHHQNENYLDTQGLIDELRADSIGLNDPMHVIKALFRMRCIHPDFEKIALTEFETLYSIEEN